MGYVTIMMKHRRLITLLMLLSLMLGMTYYVYAKPLYRVKSLVQYRALDRPVDAQKVFNDSGDREILSDLTAPHILERTAKSLGINPDPRILYSRHLSSVSCNFNSERNIEVTVYAYDKKMVSKWTEAMLREYFNYRDEKRNDIRNTLISSFSNEMNQVSSKLNEMLDSRFEFQNTNEMTQIMMQLNQLKDVPRELMIVTHRVGSMESTLNTLKTDKSLNTSAKLALLNSANREMDLTVGQIVGGAPSPTISPSALGVPTLAVQQQATIAPGQPSAPQIVVMPSMVDSDQKEWQQLDKKRVQLEKLVEQANRIYLPANPKMAALNRELKSVTDQLDNELETSIQRFELEYANLKNKRTELEDKLPLYNEVMKKAERFKQDYSLMQAGQLSWATMYQEMARQINTMNYGASKDRSQLQFVGHFEVRDTVPISPNRLKLMLMSLGLGLGLALGVPFLIEFLDHTVNNVEEVEATFQLRGLGIVPRIEGEHLAVSPVIDVEKETERHLLENFRVIRTNLLSAGSVANRPSQVIMVASAMPQEGKTVISTNLAIAFAQIGEKTLLIDADLRRGRLHRVFGLKAAPGVSDVLLQGVSLEESCRPTGKPNLDIFSCGDFVHGATEQLGAVAFAKVMDSLRQKYDRIVIDTPPILGISETSMMQNIVDGVIFVIWSGRTPERTARMAIETLRANKANFFGFVLNRLDLSTSTNYYNYYYYTNNYYSSYDVVEKS